MTLSQHATNQNCFQPVVGTLQVLITELDQTPVEIMLSRGLNNVSSVFLIQPPSIRPCDAISYRETGPNIDYLLRLVFFSRLLLLSTLQALSRAAKRQLGTAAAAPKMVYPAYVTDAPVTEVSSTSNGVRVASEVSHSLPCVFLYLWWISPPSS